MDQAQRRLARDQEELLLFLQHDVGGPQQDIVAVAVRDPAERAHAARDDDHRVRSIGAARKWGVHALQIVRDRAGRQAQAAGKFLGDHRRRVAAEHDVKLVLAGIEIVEQALSVKGAAGSGDGDKYSQVRRMVES